MNNLTIVTALFDLGRDKLPDGFRRDFSHYIECFEKFLKATKDYPLIVYIEPQNEAVVWKHRDRSNTRTVIKTLDYLREFPFYQQVQDIRQKPEWYGQSGWMPDSPQAKLELYNPLVMSKQFMLNDATLFGFFDTKYFLWMDAGLSNTVNLDQYIDSEFERRVTPHLNKMMYVCFPYDGNVEVHGFTKGPMDRYAGQKTEYVARGGVFGGSKDAINRVNDVYYATLHDTITNGYMGTEESVFTIISYKHKDYFNIRMIENNGLVYKFFEDIKKEPLRRADVPELALYALTFNLPKQFKMFAESLKKAHPKVFASAKKYVINNSNEAGVDAEYQALFTEYGFEETKYDNIGINGARHACAEHFAKSEHEYMVFFEDDMLLQHDANERCKNGFTTYHKDMFEKAIDIVRGEKLDYLKLCFTEFYGDNHDNWGYHNVPRERRDEWFPIRADGVSEKKTKIDYTGSEKGLPFAVGEYHYCNWPILFTKNANQKIFLDTVYDHKFEQTWMSLTYQLIREKKLKVGSLLATTINHYRKYHYKAGTRRENEKYTN